MMEARLILATIAQRFDLRLAPGPRVEPEAMVTLRPKRGLRMILEPRAG
jgi:cytochrome P450